jgi:hypothetical protein
LTWTLIRYRLPVDAVLIVFSALAFYDLSERLRGFYARKRVASTAL